ncbi:peptidyl-tRNA hydrolase PTH2-domain-containing protein [Tricharina praecox]|uniref:peptidyl-tRNA hydrolase PTH2-domain-containing protein n=1 Tax=Tricharina praecox TaxID=43433 RepID=UPI00221E6B0D|nr:peptidyl-tRNA hydrolase PTH2-domain-containing protein [Tricharina praecox]KAI5859163.1 peptidyl-tRNA hydrolase PTH2-domain-containing protein [Tricharina praecox]
MAPSLSHPAVSLLTTAIAASVGYYIGKSSGLRRSSVVHELQAKARSAPTSEDEFVPKKAEKGAAAVKEEEEEEEEEEEDGSDEEEEDDSDDDENAEGISSFPGNDEDCKMIFVVRTDLGMTKGKIAAQCGHATLMCYKTALRLAPALVRRWETRGQTKIAVQLKDGGEDALEELLATAISLGVVARVVRDAGRTQIAAGSATVLGLGPAPKSVVDAISGHLKLL